MPKKTMVKRFAVFSGDLFYPNGGWKDFQSSHATLTEAKKALAPGDWLQIVDLSTGRIVAPGK
jgi:hypothetical protein